MKNYIPHANFPLSAQTLDWYRNLIWQHAFSNGISLIFFNEKFNEAKHLSTRGFWFCCLPIQYKILKFYKKNLCSILWIRIITSSKRPSSFFSSSNGIFIIWRTTVSIEKSSTSTTSSFRTTSSASAYQTVSRIFFFVKPDTSIAVSPPWPCSLLL